MKKNSSGLSGMQFRITSQCICVCLFLLLCSISRGQFDPFTNITDDNIAHYDPAIYGNYVVYEAWVNGAGKGIILYNIITGEKLKLNSGETGIARNPDIYGDRIVWADNRDGAFKIYTYLISRPELGDYKLFDIDGEQTSPALFENTLVWIDHRGDEFSSNVFMYDINTAKVSQITTDDDLQQYNPDIYGPNIVYYDRRNGNSDIYLYNINTQEETRLTEDPAEQTNPSIHKGRIVWEDERNGNKDLYMHHIYYWPGSVYENFDWPIYTGDGFRQISTYNDENPAVYDDHIVFQSYRNGSWDLYLYSFVNDIFGRTTPLITEDKDQLNPAIYDNHIVWQDERDWNGTSPYHADIWLWTRPPGADLGVSIAEYPESVTTGIIASYTILVKNFGAQDATETILTQTIPEEFEFVHATSSSGNRFEQENNKLKCMIGNLMTGESDSIRVFIKTLRFGEATSICEISANEDDPFEDNNIVEVTTRIRSFEKQVISTGGNPSIATDTQENVHILYTGEYFGLEKGSIWYVTNKTGEWVIERNLTDSKDIVNKSIAIDSDDNPHIIYSTGDYGDRSIMYINKTSGEWSQPILIKKHTGNCASLTLHLDSDDKMHIAYVKNIKYWDILLYMNNTAGDWQEEVIHERAYELAALELDNNNHAHFICISSNEEGDPYSFKPTYVTNSPEGNWSEPEYVEEDYMGGYFEAFSFDLAVDHNGVPHIAYLGEAAGLTEGTEVLKYASKNEGTWSTEVIDDREFDFYWPGYISIVIDPDNQPHLIYCYNKSWDEIELIYSKLNNNEWEKQILEPGETPIYKVDLSADNSGNMHAVCRKDIGELFFVNYYFINGSLSYPEVFAVPDHITFDPQAVETVSQYNRIVIQNTGDKLLTIHDVYISDNGAGDFTIQKNTCNTLNTLGTCVVDVAFNPHTAGYKYARLRIISNDPENPDFKIPLEGIATAPNASIHPEVIPFDIYPNPGRNQLWITPNTSGLYELKILSTCGNVQLQQWVNLNANDPYILDLGTLKSGIYIVEAREGLRCFRKKLIIYSDQ